MCVLFHAQLSISCNLAVENNSKGVVSKIKAGPTSVDLPLAEMYQVLLIYTIL